MSSEVNWSFQETECQSLKIVFWRLVWNLLCNLAKIKTSKWPVGCPKITHFESLFGPVPNYHSYLQTDHITELHLDILCTTYALFIEKWMVRIPPGSVGAHCWRVPNRAKQLSSAPASFRLLTLLINDELLVENELISKRSSVRCKIWI